MSTARTIATLVVLAFVLFLLAARSRKKTGIPAGEVFYQDLPGQPFFGEQLRSNALGISGKPDCLVRTVDGTVPVELKNSSSGSLRLFEGASDTLSLASSMSIDHSCMGEEADTLDDSCEMDVTWAEVREMNTGNQLHILPEDNADQRLGICPVTN